MSLVRAKFLSQNRSIRLSEYQEINDDFRYVETFQKKIMSRKTNRPSPQKKNRFLSITYPWCTFSAIFFQIRDDMQICYGPTQTVYTCLLQRQSSGFYHVVHSIDAEWPDCPRLIT